MKETGVNAQSRKPYAKPKIVHTEKIETRAIACAMANDAQCSAGPLQS